MAYLEGIAIFQNSAQSRPMPALEEEGIKDPAIQKDIYERTLKHVREYPVPEPNGIQNVLDSLTHPNARTVNRRASWTPVSWKKSENLALSTNFTVARAKLSAALSKRKRR